MHSSLSPAFAFLSQISLDCVTFSGKYDRNFDHPEL
jgi:hypothetical protein